MDTKSLWESLKKGVETGIKTITEKTEELTEMGRLKLEIMSSKREIEKYFIELGGRIYQLMKENATGDIGQRAEIRALVDKIKVEEKRLDDLNVRFESIRKDSKEETEGKTGEPGAPNL